MSQQDATEGAVRKLNTKAEDRLVTIAENISQLDGEANLTFDGSTLVVTGAAQCTTDLTVGGDITIDDGGSLKEANGTAAFTFDGSGNVTKIGQDSPASDQVLTWDGAKAVWAAGGGGGGAAANDANTILHMQVFAG